MPILLNCAGGNCGSRIILSYLILSEGRLLSPFKRQTSRSQAAAAPRLGHGVSSSSAPSSIYLRPRAAMWASPHLSASFCGAPMIGATLKTSCEKLSHKEKAVFRLHKENF